MRELKYRAYFNDQMSHPFTLGEAVCWPDGKVSTANRVGKIMQYIGIKDVNGVEIYESYAVQTCESDYSQIGVIKFGRFASSHEAGYSRHHYHYGFYIENEAGQVFGNCGEDVDMDKLTVVGNIHENPELLNNKSK